MSDRKYKVLSIDAWADGDEGQWSWNNWYTVDTIDSLPETDKAIEVLIDLGVLAPKARELCEVEDDGYNLTIVDKRDSCPLYAIEYGNEDHSDSL